MRRIASGACSSTGMAKYLGVILFDETIRKKGEGRDAVKVDPGVGTLQDQGWR